MQNINFLTADSVKIAANYFKNGKDKVVIIAPGWCMTKDSKAFLEISNAFCKEFDVICFDFRGHGKSGGFYTFTSNEEKDLNSAVMFAKERYKKIYLAGFSLGGAVSLLYAAKNEEISAVIAVSPPSDFNKIENKMWKREAWGETFKKFELKRFLSIRPSLIIRKKEKPIDFADKIKAPVLFMAGALDPTVCPWHTEKLFKKAACKKEYKLFKKGIHAEDLFLYNREEFMKTCFDFLCKNC